MATQSMDEQRKALSRELSRSISDLGKQKSLSEVLDSLNKRLTPFFDTKPKSIHTKANKSFFDRTLNRPGFTGDCLVLLTRLYRLRSCLHRMPPQLQLA